MRHQTLKPPPSDVKNPIAIDPIKTKERNWLPIHIECVLDELSDNNSLVNRIKEYAISENVLVTTREYNSLKYTNDRDIIERLPAFHIFIKRIRFRTFYPDTRPIQHIQETIEEHKKRIIQEERKKSRFKRLVKYITSLFKRKTRMEQYEEERLKDSKNIVPSWR